MNFTDKKMREGYLNPTATQKAIRILGICVLAGILIYFLTKNNAGISIAVKDDHLSLSYPSEASVTINYKDILSVNERGDLDPGKYVSGIDTNNYKFGVWDNGEFGKYHLCIYAKVERYIVVKTSPDIFIFNFESADATDSFYKAFLELLQTGQAQVTP
jgi:hypothetical protein